MATPIPLNYGKYKDKKLEDITDLVWLKYEVKNNKLPAFLRNEMKHRIIELEDLYR